VAHQTYEIPAITLAIATTTTEVVVEPMEVIAAQQMNGLLDMEGLRTIDSLYEFNIALGANGN
jgi:hypothetical protein